MFRVYPPTYVLHRFGRLQYTMQLCTYLYLYVEFCRSEPVAISYGEFEREVVALPRELHGRGHALADSNVPP